MSDSLCLAVFFSRFPTRLWAGCIAAAVLVTAGCWSSDEIVVYESVSVTRVPKPGATRLGEGSAKVPVKKVRMLAAITDQPSATWFFKVKESVETVEDFQPKWEKFLKTVTFAEDGNPQWELPTGWQLGGERPMRFATLVVGDLASAALGKKPIEISISDLPPPQSLLANINRWRGQIGLAKIEADQLSANVTTLESGAITFQIFDAIGTEAGGMQAPFAGGQRPPGMAPMVPSSKIDRPVVPTVTQESLPVRFVAPTGWESGKISTVAVGRWHNEVAGGMVELSVLQMSSSSESWKMNVAAWGNQLQLEATPDADSLTETVTVAGVTARRIRLTNPAYVNNEKQTISKTIVALMFEAHDVGWWVKLYGEESSVTESMDTLEQFLKSISITP